jgi:toxin ParE1/3/4
LYYTFREWYFEHADLYQSSIKFDFSRLAENPFQGKSIDVIKLGYFRFDIKTHSIFYYVEKNLVIIVRILNEMMDSKRHLLLSKS